MIGVVFSKLQQADNIGHIIPIEEIELFLNDARDGHYDGKPALLDEFQHLENDAILRKLKLPPDKNDETRGTSSGCGCGKRSYDCRD